MPLAQAQLCETLVRETVGPALDDDAGCRDEDARCSAGNPAASRALWVDRTISLPDDFRLESGEALTQNQLHLRFLGNVQGKPVVVTGGISSHRRLCDDEEGKGWWQSVFKGSHEGGINFSTHCFIGVDFLPNAREQAQTLSTRDQARAIHAALRAAGIERLAGYVGSSYGGMVGLQLASLFPGFCAGYFTLCAAHKPNPTAAAYRAIQRRIIALTQQHGCEDEGLSIARQIAMVGYRTPQEFSARFSCLPGRAARANVESYLESKGRDFCKLFTPQRYITLSQSIDTHYVDPASLRDPLYLLAVRSDQLVPLADMEELAASAAGPVRFFSFASLYGHDGFLCEAEQVGTHAARFLKSLA